MQEGSPLDGRTLNVSHIREPRLIASRLDGVQDRHDVLILRRLVLEDEHALAALSTALQRNFWERVELQNVHGSVRSVVHALCTVAISQHYRINELQLVLPNQDFAVEEWTAISQSICANPKASRPFDSSDRHSIATTTATTTATTSLTCLRVTTGLTAAGMRCLAQGLAQTATLTTLDLSNCTLDQDEAITLLAEGLGGNKSLNNFFARNCGVSDVQLATLIRPLGSHPSLIHLDLDSNRGGPRTSHALASLLSAPTSSIQRLVVSHQRPFQGYRRPRDESEGDRQRRLDVPVVAGALWGRNRALRVLDLSDCHLDDVGLDSLIRVMMGGVGRGGSGEATSNVLEQLLVPRNQITDEGLKRLGAALPNIHGLKRISLWANPFDEVGVQAFCDGLQRNMDLEEVDLFRKFTCSETIQYYTLLNRAGRRLLHDVHSDDVTAASVTDGDTSRQNIVDASDPALRRKPVPLGLWPIVLERLQKLHLPESGDQHEGATAFTHRMQPPAIEANNAPLSGVGHSDMLYYMLRSPAIFSK